MLLPVRIYFPDKLLAKAKEVAAARETTLTVLIIEQLEALTESKADDSILMFSRGLLTKEQAVEYSLCGTAGGLGRCRSSASSFAKS